MSFSKFNDLGRLRIEGITAGCEQKGVFRIHWMARLLLLKLDNGKESGSRVGVIVVAVFMTLHMH